MAILDEEQFFEQPIVHQNPDVIDIPTPRQASGNEDGIMFLMCLSLFNCINGFISVKQQPKANNHVRYQCDGARFLPDSRYHPMAINVCFFPLIKYHLILMFFSYRIYGHIH